MALKIYSHNYVADLEMILCFFPLLLFLHKCVSPLLFDLHWLPVEYRSQYKILLLVYKSLHGKGPAYLASMLEEYSPIRSLRSATQLRLYEPRVKKRYGDRAFSVAGPSLWNDLDPSVKQSSSVTVFKTRLKTYLFQKAFKGFKV